MELKVGDFVLAAHPTSVHRGIGHILDVERYGGPFWVRWPAVSDSSLWYVSELIRVCRNCHKPEDAHTKWGRCLFGASRWR